MYNVDLVAKNAGKVYQKVRKECKISRRAISERSGVSETTITMMENYSHLPTTYTMLRLMNAMNIDFEKFCRLCEMEK